jgi:thiamine monophosphate kinase
VEAINDGEDYELLLALAPDDARALQKEWRKKFPRLPLTRIGCLTRQSSLITRPSLHGFLHFQ